MRKLTNNILLLKSDDQLPEAERFNVRYRRRVVVVLAILTLIGNGSNALLIISGIVNDNIVGRLATTIPIIAVSGLVLVLALFKRVELAGIIYCITATIGITAATIAAGSDSTVQGLYPVIIVLAGTIISAQAVLYFGVAAFVTSLTVNIVLIVNATPPVPAVRGTNTALTALIIFVITVIVYIFSDNLYRFGANARRQAQELSEANLQLQQQRGTEKQVNRQINELTTLLAEVFRDQRGVTTQQAILVTEVASTTQELDAAARRIADNAQSVAQVAERALKSAEYGQFSAQDGVNAINNLRYRVENITESVRYLSNQIQRINEVTLFIGEIADETNLLALNATIEAAGAREYGRRFSAVAEEVQRLARRAADSVIQIQGMVTEVTQASAQSLEATEEGLRQAQAGADLISRLNYANTEIITLVNQTSELAASIANATQQQRNASAHIVTAIEQISISTTELARTGDEANELVLSLELSTSSLRDSN